jgi:hypothetical protein
MMTVILNYYASQQQYSWDCDVWHNRHPDLKIRVLTPVTTTSLLSKLIFKPDMFSKHSIISLRFAFPKLALSIKIMVSSPYGRWVTHPGMRWQTTPQIWPTTLASNNIAARPSTVKLKRIGDSGSPWHTPWHYGRNPNFSIYIDSSSVSHDHLHQFGLPLIETLLLKEFLVESPYSPWHMPS